VPPARRTRRRDSEATKTRILRAAVRHFGEYGYEGASLRNILGDADASLASANYHFGTKAELLRAAIERYMVRTRERRLALLDEADRAPAGRPRIRALTEAYIRPHLEIVIGEREHDYGRLIFRMAIDSHASLLSDVEEALFPVRRRYRDALAACCPDVDDARLATAISFVIGTLVMAPFEMNPGTLTIGSVRDAPVDEVLATAAAFAYGGLIQVLGFEGEDGATR